MRSTYIRFVVGGDDENHRMLTGIVAEARFLRDRGELSYEEEQRLEAVYVWLNSNLPCPPFFSSGWSRGAVSWFKDSASEPISKFRVLAALLEHHNRGVRMLRSHNPGKVLYEDQFQIVVEEWKKL
jgi:hypothetical protein